MEPWLLAVNILLWLLSLLLISFGMVLVVVDVQFWYTLSKRIRIGREEQSSQKGPFERINETISHGRTVMAAASFALASFLMSLTAVLIALGS